MDQHFSTLPVDRLSSLPDGILGDILSLLPTETAVSTSVLSHRWRYLWTRITSLHLDFHHSPLENSESQTVNDQLLTRLTSPFLRDFILLVPFQRHLRFVSLLRHLCSRLVENIQIDVKYFYFFHTSSKTFTTPNCIFQTQTLVSLQLTPFMFPDDYCDVIINLPNLRKLRLTFPFSQRVLVAKLVRSCPLLEDLDLTAPRDWFEDGLTDGAIAAPFDISCPNLKHLKLCLLLEVVFSKVVIDAPKLDSFYLKISSLASCTFVNKPVVLRKATIVSSNRIQEVLMSLLPMISNVMLLDIPCVSFGMLERCKEPFNNLSELRLQNFRGYGDDALPDFSFESSSPSVLLQIKRIKITVIDGNLGNNFKKLADYLLSNAPALETLTALVNPYLVLSEDMEKYKDEGMLGINLDLFSRDFPRCLIEIDDQHDWLGWV